MGDFWPRIYVVKKGHARDIYFLLQTRSFWHFSACPWAMGAHAVHHPGTAHQAANPGGGPWTQRRIRGRPLRHHQ
jgi:hypothetical protein